ncbi:MAG: helix-turn-helix domain-containing protein [Clostridiales bacterium]|jgi:transcriptional regulator with XRE-family HTH domain|nr:helix-turn-helix domain-containing protein [Clostridiales bacterium]
MENRLRELRKGMNLKQTDLAEMLHIASSTYSYWESGTVDVDLKCLVILANFFGVSVDYILKRNGEHDESDRNFRHFIISLKQNGISSSDLAGLSSAQSKLFADLLKNLKK